MRNDKRTDFFWHSTNRKRNCDDAVTDAITMALAFSVENSINVFITKVLCGMLRYVMYFRFMDDATFGRTGRDAKRWRRHLTSDHLRTRPGRSLKSECLLISCVTCVWRKSLNLLPPDVRVLLLGEERGDEGRRGSPQYFCQVGASASLTQKHKSHVQCTQLY